MAAVRAVRSRRGTQEAITCRISTLNDFARINALERRYRLGFRSYEEWSHMWVNNPVCKRMPDLPIGWVLEDAQGEIVGSIGSVPFGFEINGRRYLAGTSSAWVTGITVPWRGLLGRSADGTDVQLPEPMSSVVKAR